MTKRPLPPGFESLACPEIGGIIQDMAIERRQWLMSLVASRSRLSIRLQDGGVVVGTYMCHDQETITVSNETYAKAIRFMEIDGIDQLA